MWQILPSLLSSSKQVWSRLWLGTTEDIGRMNIGAIVLCLLDDFKILIREVEAAKKRLSDRSGY